MSPASAYILLGYMTLVRGSQSPMDASSLLELPINYTYTPGIGAHKIHTEWNVWATARRICKKEGGHLAIINSAAEAKVLSELLKQVDVWEAFVGIHDMFEENEWVTIHNEPLAYTGFNEWDDSEPNDVADEENCGAFRSNKKLNDYHCSRGLQFICELIIEPTSSLSDN